MDFTHPAGRLHLSQATLHPLVLEYYQGMWHLIINVYALKFKHTQLTSICLFQHDLCQQQAGACGEK